MGNTRVRSNHQLRDERFRIDSETHRHVSEYQPLARLFRKFNPDELDYIATHPESDPGVRALRAGKRFVRSSTYGLEGMRARAPYMAVFVVGLSHLYGTDAVEHGTRQ